MAITGSKRQESNFEKVLKIGVGEVKVLCVNPSREEYKEILGMDLQEESKADQYLGESKDNNTTLRVDVWVESVKTGDKDKITFFLENKEKTNKDLSKKQYINQEGVTSWASDPNNLPDWFKKRDYRVAYQGEEELHNFMRAWLGKLDVKNGELLLDWKPLMKGNVKEIKSSLGCEFETPFLVLYTVKSVEKDGETKNYQSIYNKQFLPSYLLKFFRNVNFDNSVELDRMKAKNPKNLKGSDKMMYNFITTVIGEYGVKDAYSLREVHEFNPDEHIQASNKVLAEDTPDY